MNRHQPNETILRSHSILGIRIDATSYVNAVQRITLWAKNRESRYICIANVHMVMEAYDASDFRQIVNNADLVTPDGMPLVWVMRFMGVKGQERVYGPGLTLRVAEIAAEKGIPIGLYGGTPEVVKRLAENLQEHYPHLRIVYRCSPPFRPLTEEEDNAIVEAINASGARILLMGLGCPKQERWMAAHKGRVQAVMLGVGAAFDFLTGRKPQAPRWMQRAGLEWLFRLLTEPRRLWRRYLINNPRFVALVMLQLMRERKIR